MKPHFYDLLAGLVGDSGSASEAELEVLKNNIMSRNAWTGDDHMKIQCELCLLQYGYSKPSDSIKLVRINGVDALVCKQHNPDNLFVQR